MWLDIFEGWSRMIHPGPDSLQRGKRVRKPGKRIMSLFGSSPLTSATKRQLWKDRFAPLSWTGSYQQIFPLVGYQGSLYWAKFHTLFAHYVSWLDISLGHWDSKYGKWHSRSSENSKPDLSVCLAKWDMRGLKFQPRRFASYVRWEPREGERQTLFSFGLNGSKADRKRWIEGELWGERGRWRGELWGPRGILLVSKVTIQAHIKVSGWRRTPITYHQFR